MSWWRWNSTSKIFEISSDDGSTWAPPSLDASVLNQGIIGSVARIATGTPTGAKFVRDDLTLAVPAGTPTTSASDLTSGTLADARLSSNIPLKDGTNAFTGANSFATNTLDLLVGQLKFPATQNPSSDANILDDYEEGTWTPIIGGDGGQTGQSYTTQLGKYTKISQLVVASFYVVLSTLGSVSGTLNIQAFPFTNISTYYAPGTISYWITGTAFVNLQLYMPPLAASAYITGITAASSTMTASRSSGDLTNTSGFMGVLCYRSA